MLGEAVALASPVAVTGRVEVWLSDLAASMKDTLAGLLVDSLASVLLRL